jgi:N-methylhydantoinase B
MFDALPIHTTSMHLVLDEIAKTFEGEIKDGDVYLCNHPYRRNTHVGDVVVATPVFVRGKHMFWTVSKGHHLDIGALVPSSVTSAARNVWQEGIHIPPIKIYDEGVARKDVIDFFLTNLRYPELQRGDLLAQLGSVWTAKARLIELAEEYGPDELQSYVDAIIDYADRRTAAEIRTMPDGVYEAETWIDSDGAGTVNVPIKVKIEIGGDRVDIDYAGSGPQSPTGVNGSFATSQAAPAIPFMYYIAPDIPHNHGCFSHISIDAPEGSVCNAKYPASTSLATIVPTDAMHDVVNKAMAQAIPDRVVAGGARAANMPNFSGIDERTGKPWAVMLFNNGGGFGAARETDGWPILATLAGMGGLKSLLIEQAELLYPFVVEHMEIEPDSMGLGEWIGGPGVRFVMRPTAGPVDCITFGDGHENPPFGVLGGTAGVGGGQYVADRADTKRRFYSSTAYYTIGRDEVRVGVSTGGGGYGDPLDRPADQVRCDVRDGFVTADTARKVFGVVLRGSDLAVDTGESERLRAELRRKRELPLVTPNTPGASTWLKETMREADEYFLNPVAGMEAAW